MRGADGVAEEAARGEGIKRGGVIRKKRHSKQDSNDKVDYDGGLIYTMQHATGWGQERCAGPGRRGYGGGGGS